MRIAVAVDHAGFPLKVTVIATLRGAGHKVIDLGTNSTETVDYPDYADKLAGAILGGQAERGVLVCGSGVGASVAASKIRGIRAGLCHDVYSAHQGVEHDDVNVLCLGARIIGPATADEIVRSFAGAQFSADERHLRRVRKIAEMERRGVPLAMPAQSSSAS